MAVQENATVAGETIVTAQGSPEPSPGSVGLKTQLPGEPTTVSTVAEATGGVGAGNLIEPDIDEQLFRFNSDDTPLMNLMLRAKKVKVNSCEVDHYMIDEPKAIIKTTSAFNTQNASTIVLPIAPEDFEIPRPYTTLLVKGVNGYTADGKDETPGMDLLLFVTGHDSSTGAPIARAVNGRRTEANAETTYIPEIPAGTELVILANAMYETQKEVDPDLIVPMPSRVYLQKRGMNQVVSDYFASQKKRIPFAQSLIAEQAIANFKTRGNRTLWVGRGGKFKLSIPKMGMQYVYTTEGVRWQFKRQLKHTGRWTFEQLIGLAKMFFTGEDVPKTALLLAGKNLLEGIQCIDFSKHPEVQISLKTNKLGWDVTNIHTVFGDIEIKREPTLDRLGWSNSGALLGEDRLVHYERTTEHSFNDRIEGEEASRNGVIVWDALALKGSCHIWIEGEDTDETASSISTLVFADSNFDEADAVVGQVYYFTEDVQVGSYGGVSAGTALKYLGEDDGWEEFDGHYFAQ